MRTPTKLSAYGLALAVVFGGAWAAGAAIGPLAPGAGRAGHRGVEQVSAVAHGLAATENGYLLSVAQSYLGLAKPQELSFRVLDRDGGSVTRYDTEPDKRLRLIIIRRDGTGYQRLSPALDVNGAWRTVVTLPIAGTYRLLADFTPLDGPRTTLGSDIQVAGPFDPAELTWESRTSTVDGYTVRLDGELTTDRTGVLTATVSRDGRPVTDLEPNLGTSGHLVAVRAADLAYLHVRQEAAGAVAGQVRFAAQAASSGRYRLFLDFQVGGVARVADFTVSANDPTDGQRDQSGGDDHAGHGG